MIDKTLNSSKLIISNCDFIHLVDYHDIIYCMSDGGYSHIYAKGDQHYILAKSLGQLAQKLMLNNFIRVSQQYIINRNAISKIDRRQKKIHLQNQVEISFTITLKDLLRFIDLSSDCS
ncbi:LytR/AlgR family response regulator transcription factor [Pedobacter sp. MW01-1-1]|uniref:LytR/AlgR family response regulator transcription factor n=1 Tax=Pedobacter sp. MW01-1-1 TaxID=3383027 RepID=UPI003FEE50CD